MPNLDQETATKVKKLQTEITKLRQDQQKTLLEMGYHAEQGDLRENHAYLACDEKANLLGLMIVAKKNLIESLIASRKKKARAKRS